MILGLLGDIHGSAKSLKAWDTRFKALGAEALIQVGDFGFSRERVAIFERKGPYELPIYAIEGNHEDYDFIHAMELAGDPPVGSFLPGIMWVPRGTVFDVEFAGIRIGFLGGAASVDKAWRVRAGPLMNQRLWFEEELVTDADIAKFDGVDRLDLLVTHGPPQSIVDAHFDPKFLQHYFDLPLDWKDPGAAKIEALWARLGRPPLVCGHMHRSVVDGNVRILDINEGVLLDTATMTFTPVTLTDAKEATR
jgi:hypothetical protein